MKTVERTKSFRSPSTLQFRPPNKYISTSNSIKSNHNYLFEKTQNIFKRQCDHPYLSPQIQ